MELSKYTEVLTGFHDEIFEFDLEDNVIKRLDGSIDRRFDVVCELEPSIFRIIDTLIYPDDRKKILQFYKGYKDGDCIGQNSELEFRLYSEGESIWIYSHINSLTDFRYIVIISDETREKQNALAAQRYHMITDLMINEEAPFGVVIINLSDNKYEIITSAIQARDIPDKGRYNDLMGYMTNLVRDEADKKKISMNIDLDNVVQGLEQNNGIYRFSYNIFSPTIGGLREVSAKYSDQWKNQIIAVVRFEK